MPVSADLPPSLTLEQAAGRRWDALVVGAGPSGSIAARELASQGASVLLVDKASFPRPKICGCCLNSAALAVLRSMGLGGLPARLGAQPLARFRLAAGRRYASLSLPDGMSVSRERFDAALVQEAVRVGAAFLPETEASLDAVYPYARCLLLRRDGRKTLVEACLVLAADGVGGRLAQGDPGIRRRVARRSRIGIGVAAEGMTVEYEPGTIFMGCGIGGYVGLVRLEDGRLNVAAALDPALIRNAGGPGPAVERILRQAGLPAVKGLTGLVWRGTPPLTSRRVPPAGERLFIIGDAAGYVEPFTGEGIAWALASGRAVAPLAFEAARRWKPWMASQWARAHGRLIGRRQLSCRITANLLRRRSLTQAAVDLLSRAPFVGASLVRYIHRELA